MIFGSMICRLQGEHKDWFAYFDREGEPVYLSADQAMIFFSADAEKDAYRRISSRLGVEFLEDTV